MVRFEPNKMIIEFDSTQVDPTEAWINIIKDLIDLLSSQEIDQMTNRYWTRELLSEMMPDFDTAKKMINE